MTKDEKIRSILQRGVEEIIHTKHLESVLKGKKKLRVKLGIDPTSPNIHIGRAVVLWKLRAFQDLGHQVVFIVGDFTGQIGDTSDKDAERPMLTEAEIAKNVKTYLDQAYKILDKDKTEAHYNSTWLKKLGFAEIGQLANLFGLHEFSARENIAKRLDAFVFALPDGKEVKNNIYIDEPDLVVGNVVRIQMLTIDENVYRYLFSITQITGNGGPPTAPANPTSNFNNEALGYFSASTSTEQTITIE